MKNLFLVALIILGSCNNRIQKEKVSIVNSKETQTTSVMDEDIFKNKVVIILAKELNGGDSHSIRIQNYYENGESFIPVFSSISKFDESSKGMIKNPTIQIDGYLLLSILNGNENIRINPTLNDERIYKASELIKKYSEEIKAFSAKMETEYSKTVTK